jgi:RHS repeat-associated protein
MSFRPARPSIYVHIFAAQRSLVLLVLCFSTLISAANAQVDPAAGIVPFSTRVGGPYDSLDLASDNITVNIPLRSKTGKFSFSLSLIANSHIFIVGSVQQKTWFVNTALFPAAFAAHLGAGVDFLAKNYGACAGHNTDSEYYGFSVADATGAFHSFGGLAVDKYGCLGDLRKTGLATDGSGFILTADYTTGTISLSLYDRSGNSLTHQTVGYGYNYGIEDPDGTAASEVVGWTASDPTQQITYTDSLGETTLSGSWTGGYQGAADTYWYTDVGGSKQTYTVSYTGYYFVTNFGCAQVNDQNSGTTVVYFPTKITLPSSQGSILISYEQTPNGNGHTYNSNYVTGRLSKITYPNGGSVAYAYSGGNNGINCSSGVVPTLRRTLNDNNNMSTWTYVNTNSSLTPSNYTITAIDPAGNNAVYNFTGENQTQLQVYQGSVAPTHLLNTTVTCYNKNFSSCPSLATPPAQISQTDVFTYPGTSTSASLVETAFNGSGTVAEIKKYDFGAAATLPPTAAPTASPVSDTTASYDGQNGTVCGTLTNGYIYDRPCTIQTVNSLGAPVSQVNYTYNGTGHPTQTSTLVGGTNFLNSSATYDPTYGTLTTSTDVNGAITNYYYNGTGGCGNLLPTSVGLPLGLSSSQTWYCDGGVLHTSTDPSGKVTTYGYANQGGTADPFWRLLSAKDPLGNTTWTIYSAGGVLPATVETNLNFPVTTPTSTVDTLNTLDGLGRVVKSQNRTSPTSTTFDGTVQNTYAWNTTGAVTTQTVPGGTAVTTTQSDALGRPLTVTDGGGGTVSYTYKMNDVLQSVGPAQNFSKQFEYDGLGRLASVCEITSASGSGSCGQANAATGFLTKYSYDALGNLLMVTQNAQPGAIGGQQSRTFSYDGLGRLLSESNPESGAKTYVYDTTSALCNGGGPATFNGDLIMSTDAAGKCIVYFYDALHRLTDVGNNNQTAANPCRRFRYDNSSGYPGSTKPSGLANTLGRLIEAATDTCISQTNDALLTDEWFSYDADARQTDLYQSTPNSAGYYHTTAQYWANGTLNTLSGVPGFNNWTFTPDGEGRPSSATYGSTNWVTGTSYYPSSANTTVTFGNNDTDVYGFDSTTGRMNSFQFNVGATTKSLTGTVGWNANGTLGSLGIVDQLNAPNSQNCTYAYDDLGRLAGKNSNGYSVDCGSNWQQLFTLDAFGNISKSGPSGTFAASYLLSNGTTNNREQTVGSCIPLYDANGNTTKDCTYNNSYSWNVYGNAAQLNAWNITYDAFGREVEIGSNIPKQVLYSPIGKLGMMNGQTAETIRIPLPGGSTAELLASGNQEHTLHTDWLGSSRFSTSFAGRSLTYDVSYAPFGESYNAYPASGVDVDFTGQYLDTLPHLYDFTFREYEPAQGRWISPDPAGVSAVNSSNPQSWNRYAYVLNNPLVATDPFGLYCNWGNGTWDDLDGGANQSDCEDQGGFWVDGISTSEALQQLQEQGTPIFQVDATDGTGTDGSGAATSTFGTGNIAATGQISPLSTLGCAATFAPSLARTANIQGDTFLGKVGQTILGNTFSGMYDTYKAFTSANGTVAAFGSLAVNGLRQGLPGGGPLGQGLSGVAQDATLKFAFQNLGAQRLGQATVNAAASTVGDVKIGYDALAFLYTAYQCKYGFGN